MIRTHDAGTLTAADAGQTVTLAGWVARRRDHGGVAFLDLREASGVVQVVVRDEDIAHHLRNEYCLKVVGEVALRPEGNANPNLPSGDIEVIAVEVEVLSAAAPLPFPIDDHVDVGEEARLKHRYLDLRRSGPNAALRLRSKVNKAARDPSGEGHGLSDVVGAQLAGVVGADHGCSFVMTLGVRSSVGGVQAARSALTCSPVRMSLTSCPSALCPSAGGNQT